MTPFICECIDKGDVDVRWISGKENMADVLTKALGRPLFDVHRGRMGMS